MKRLPTPLPSLDKPKINSRDLRLFFLLLCLGFITIPSQFALSQTPPTPSSPGGINSPGPLINTLTPFFIWVGVNGATGYGLYIRDITTDTLVYPNSSGTTTTPIKGTSLTLPSGILVAGHNYRWGVTSFLNSFESAQSSVLYFQTKATLSDLVVQNLAISPTSGSGGSNATVTFTVRNQGGGTASASTTNIRINTSSTNVVNKDPLLISLNTPSIAADGTQNVSQAVTIPSNRSAGNNFIWVILDTASTANQSNENNDRVNTTFTVLGHPPSISSVSPNPVTGSSSPQLFTINGSNFVTGANVTLRDLRTGNAFPNRQSSSFSSTRIVLNPIFTTAAANWTVEVINPDGQSSGQFQFSVVAPPANAQSDLVIQNLTVNPTSGAVGSNATVSFTIRNQGGGTASASTTNIRINTSSANVTTNDPLLISLSTPSIAAGAIQNVSQAVTIPANRPAGNNLIWVILDTGRTANQSNENNDRANTAFNVTTPQSDLIVQNLTVSPTSGQAGSNATVSFTIRNQGGGTASASTTNIRINTSSTNVVNKDPLLISLNTPSIAADGTQNVSQTVTIPSNRPTGNNFIWVILDTGRTADQSNRINDRANTSFSVVPPALLSLHPSNDEDPQRPFVVTDVNYSQRTSTFVIADITIKNITGTWFQVNVSFETPSDAAPLPVNLKDGRPILFAFLMGPFQEKTFDNIKFTNGQYLHLDVTRTSTAAYGALAMDLIARGIFGVSWRPDAFDGARVGLQLLNSILESNCANELAALGVEILDESTFGIIVAGAQFLLCTGSIEVKRTILRLVRTYLGPEHAVSYSSLLLKNLASLIAVFTHVQEFTALTDNTFMANIDGFVRLEARR